MKQWLQKMASTIDFYDCSAIPVWLWKAFPVRFNTGRVKLLEQQYNLILLSIGIMTLVLVVVFIIFFIVIFRFRRKKGEEDKIPKAS